MRQPPSVVRAMELTTKINEFQRAPSSKMVRAKFVVSLQVPVAGNGHSRSLPAEIDSTFVSPRFRSGKANELPVGMGASFTSLEPAWEPIDDPTLAQVPPAE
jgi:hypothetical protein